MKYFFILSIFISSFSFAQNLKIDESNLYRLDTVVSVNSTKDALYSNALKWLSKNFKDSRDVIESKNSELGEIVFKGNSIDYLTIKEKNKINYIPVRLFLSGKIIVKENKYRLILSQLKYSYITDNLFSNLKPTEKEILPNDKYNQLALKILKNLEDSLIDTMNLKADNDF